MITFWGLNYPDRKIISKIKITELNNSGSLDCKFNIQFKVYDGYGKIIVAELTFVGRENYEKFYFNKTREASLDYDDEDYKRYREQKRRY
jgi:hypothetical protein